MKCTNKKQHVLLYIVILYHTYNGLVTRLKKYQGPFRGSMILLGMYFWPGCYNWSIIYVERERERKKYMTSVVLVCKITRKNRNKGRAKSRNIGEIKKKISVDLYPVFLYTLDKIIFSLHFQSSVQNMPRQKLYIKYEFFLKLGALFVHPRILFSCSMLVTKVVLIWETRTNTFLK